ncbi:MAG: FG-GAP repeat domain-containing protein, partial [Thermoanaerobaculia bacterium]
TLFRSDLLLPVDRGLALYRGSAGGFERAPRLTLEPPVDFGPPQATPQPAGGGPEKKSEIPSAASQREDEERSRDRAGRRSIALPQVVDLDGDGRPELVYRDPEHSRTRLRALRQGADGSFGAPFDPLAGKALSEEREIAWIGDLDGRPGAELVTTAEIPNEKDSMRAELAEAKRPRSRVFVHRLDGRGVWNPDPVSTFEIEGYVFEGGGGDDGSDDGGDGFEFTLPSGVHDLDGDGRRDLVAIRLEFSLFEAMRIMTTHSIRLGLDFAVYRQGEGMTFRPVTGLDLAGELKLRLDDVSIGQISSFAGDFDGDGKADFVQLGRGRKVTIHRGNEGARYAPSPDLSVTLEREPADVALAQVRDLDGDGRSDLVVTQPAGSGEIGARAVLELYLSRGSP